MNTSRILTTAGLAASVAVLGAGGLAAATTAPGEPATDLGRASDAALAETGDGIVVAYSVERDGYEIEIVQADGTVLEVHLDDDFAVTRIADERHDDDDDDDDTLTSQQVAALADVDLTGAHDAALAEAGAGVVVELDYDTDDGGYDADVELDDGTMLEIDLAADLTVTATETDD